MILKPGRNKHVKQKNFINYAVHYFCIELGVAGCSSKKAADETAAPTVTATTATTSAAQTDAPAETAAPAEKVNTGYVG